MSKNLHKQFIEETGQLLRYISWKHHRKIKIKTQKTPKKKVDGPEAYKRSKEAIKRLRNRN